MQHKTMTKMNTMTDTEFLRHSFNMQCVVFGKNKTRLNSEAVAKYGEDFATAYANYCKEYNERRERMRRQREQIAKFEEFLDENGYECKWSNNRNYGCLSSSRYYTYNGVKIRFSDHIHPTGSFTHYNYAEQRYDVIDLCADGELIWEIDF